MYTATGTKTIDKEQFVTEFTPLVKRIAYHMMTRLPASVQVDDLIQAGMIGLLDAINRYEGSYGRQFESYAAQRISDPNLLGNGIAVAFVATVYGVGLANLVFLPVANKLKTIIGEHVVMQEILLDGFVAIAQGEHPRLIESRLNGYLIQAE